MTIRPQDQPELPDFDARWLTPGAQSVGRARADIGCRSVVELKTAVCVRFWPLGDKHHWPWRVAQAPAGFRRLASVPVVFFPLVANRTHDDVVADDLEENDVARAAEWNDQFARATIAQFCSTA